MHAWFLSGLKFRQNPLQPSNHYLNNLAPADSLTPCYPQTASSTEFDSDPSVWNTVILSPTFSTSRMHSYCAGDHITGTFASHARRGSLSSLPDTGTLHNQKNLFYTTKLDKKTWKPPFHWILLTNKRPAACMMAPTTYMATKWAATHLQATGY